MSSSRTVILSPRARRQVATVQAWWVEERPAAPSLFDEELAASIADLQRGITLGVVYATVRGARVYRILLPRSRYHLYYRLGVSGDRVEVVAIWHASRGRAPSL